MSKKLEPTHRYDDIIEMSYPLSTHDNIKHPHMDMSERAKIFSPFAALKGHESAIAERAKEIAEAKDILVEEFVESE